MPDKPAEEKKENEKVFRERLTQNFARARKLLEQAAEQYGINLEEVPGNAKDFKENKKRLEEESRNHPLVKLSWSYSEAAREWLASQPGMMEKLQALRDALNLGTASAETAKSQTETIKDCIEVIQWYQSFIHVKFMSALMDKMQNDGWQTENVLQNDFDGAAKIAVIAIERSMQAWLKLYELLPDREDDFLKMLGLLEKMKAMAKKEFPDAENFKRPGFDN
jgi:hypothetical protein